MTISKDHDDPHLLHLLQLGLAFAVPLQRVVAQVDDPQEVKTLPVLQQHVPNARCDLVVSQVDVAHSLQQLHHLLKTSNIQVIGTQFQTLDLMRLSGFGHVINDLLARQVAVRKVKKVSEAVLFKLTE